MKACLELFEEASGQKVNFAKPHIYFSQNLSEEKATELSSRANMPRTRDLGHYLEVQLVHTRCTKEMYGDLLDKFSRRLSGWKSKCLSLAGRIKLAKSVLNSISIYRMQTAKFLMSVNQHIDKTIRSWLWGSAQSKKTSCKMRCFMPGKKSWRHGFEEDRRHEQGITLQTRLEDASTTCDNLESSTPIEVWIGPEWERYAGKKGQSVAYIERSCLGSRAAEAGAQMVSRGWPICPILDRLVAAGAVPI